MRLGDDEASVVPDGVRVEPCADRRVRVIERGGARGERVELASGGGQTPVHPDVEVAEQDEPARERRERRAELLEIDEAIAKDPEPDAIIDRRVMDEDDRGAP